MKNQFASLCKKIYLFEFFDTFVLLYTLSGIMFQEHGISDAELTQLFIFWCFSVLIGNVIYTLIAPFVSNKVFVIWGELIKAVGFILWYVFPCFWGYMAGYFLWGVKWSFQTRAWENLVYNETVLYPNGEELYTKICSRKKAAYYLGYFGACFGSFLADLGWTFIVFSSVIPLIICALIAYFIPCRYHKLPRPLNVKKLTFSTLRVILKYPCLFGMIFLLTFCMGMSYLDEWFGVIGVEWGMQKKYVGIIYGLVLITQIIFSALAYKCEKLSQRQLYLMIVVAGFFFFLVGENYNLFGLVFLILFYAVYSVVDVLLFAQIQKRVTTQNERSVFLGVFSLFEQVGSILSAYMMWIGVQFGSFKYGFLILGSLVCLLGFIAVLLNTYLHQKKIASL